MCVRPARGGLRDIESTSCSFCSCWSAAITRRFDGAGTLAAIAGLEQAARADRAEERRVLEDSYRCLRASWSIGCKSASRPANAALPADEAALGWLGPIAWPATDAARRFAGRLASRLDQFWQTLAGCSIRRLPRSRHAARSGVAARSRSAAGGSAGGLAPFGFRDPSRPLPRCTIWPPSRSPFLSTRRCRHLLALILPQLLLRRLPPRPIPTARSTIWCASATRWAAKACCGNCFASIRRRSSSMCGSVRPARTCRTS